MELGQNKILMAVAMVFRHQSENILDSYDKNKATIINTVDSRSAYGALLKLRRTLRRTYSFGTVELWIMYGRLRIYCTMDDVPPHGP